MRHQSSAEVSGRSSTLASIETSASPASLNNSRSSASVRTRDHGSTTSTSGASCSRVDEGRAQRLEEGLAEHGDADPAAWTELRDEGAQRGGHVSHEEDPQDADDRVERNLRRPEMSHVSDTDLQVTEP